MTDQRAASLTALMRLPLSDVARVTTGAVASGRPGPTGLLGAVPAVPAALLRRRPVRAHVPAPMRHPSADAA